MSFFDELKRRNVFRVAIVYGITAWLIAQVAGLAADSFLAPEWVMKMIITILMLGMPVVLVMAWAYEMTPDGLRRETGDAGRAPGQAAGKLDRTIVIALVAALAYIAYDKLVIDPGRDTALPESTIQQSVDTTPKSAPVEETPLPSAQSIAVLPFVNMSDDSSNEYFSEGLSEELLNLLVKIPELQVAARTSSFSFKGKDVKIAQIAKELNVSHVLEGSVRKAGNRVRITAQLIKADDGFHLWSETYDRTLDDIFVVQDEIARKVVEALKVTLMGALPETRKTDPEVYALYLQGKYFNNHKGKGDLEKALLAYEQALAIDSQYAPAWIGISLVYQDQRKFGFRANDEANSLSMEAVEKALAIDNNMATAWASLAYLKRQEWDLDGAKIAIEKALQLEPNNALVIGTAATLAGTFGQLQTSIELFEKVVRLDPLGLSGLRALGIRYAYSGRYDEAIETLNRVITINPNYPYIHMTIGNAYLWKGDPETALIEIDKHRSSPQYDFRKVRILSAMGREAEAQIIINRLLKSSAQERPGLMGIVYAWRGENDLAFEWLEKDYLVRPANFSSFLLTPWCKNLENDPRYPVFLEKIGLLEYWKAMPRPDEEVKP